MIEAAMKYDIIIMREGCQMHTDDYRHQYKWVGFEAPTIATQAAR